MLNHNRLVWGLVTVAFGSVIAACASESASKQEYAGRGIEWAPYINQAEREDLEELLDSTLQTIESEEFSGNLLSLFEKYPRVYMKVIPGSVDGTTKWDTIQGLHALLTGEDSSRRQPAFITLVGGTGDYTAIAGPVGLAEVSSISIGRGHVWNWNDHRRVRKSCAVNTMAHELSHLLTTSELPLSEASQSIQDSGAASRTTNEPVASYLVGTVAQCTWLQRIGHIESKEFQTCVTVFGHRGFNSNRCTQFDNEQNLVLRDDLAPEHIIWD